MSLRFDQVLERFINKCFLPWCRMTSQSVVIPNIGIPGREDTSSGDFLSEASKSMAGSGVISKFWVNQKPKFKLKFFSPFFKAWYRYLIIFYRYRYSAVQQITIYRLVTGSEDKISDPDLAWDSAK